MKSFFIPAGSSIKVQLKVCHRVAEMPPQRTGGGVEERRGGVGGGGGGAQQEREDTVNKINYAKCPGAHQSRGNNARVRVCTHTACMLFSQ